MNDLIITNTRANAKAVVKPFAEGTRLAIDRLFALTPEVKEAARAADRAAMTVQPSICAAMSKIAADKDGLKAGGFDNFKDAACAIFGFPEEAKATISMFKRVGDKFYNVEKPPKVGEWFTVSKLQELRAVPNEKLEEDAEKGVLRPDMTLSELRAYAAKPALESGDAEIVKTFDGGYMESGESFTMLDENGIAANLNGGITPDENRVHVFKSADKFIIKATTDKGKDKEKPCYIMVIESENGCLYAAKYHEHISTTATNKPVYSGKEDAIRKAREQGLTDEQIKAIFG